MFFSIIYFNEIWYPEVDIYDISPKNKNKKSQKNKPEIKNMAYKSIQSILCE